MGTTPGGIVSGTTGMDFHALVRELNGNVGATVVQTMAGVPDRSAPCEWARPGGPLPEDPKVEARVRLGHLVWQTLSRSEGPGAALAWLMASNPGLGGELPVLYIQRQRAREVLGAAEAFISSGG